MTKDEKFFADAAALAQRQAFQVTVRTRASASSLLAGVLKVDRLVETDAGRVGNNWWWVKFWPEDQEDTPIELGFGSRKDLERYLEKIEND